MIELNRKSCHPTVCEIKVNAFKNCSKCVPLKVQSKGGMAFGTCNNL